MTLLPISENGHPLLLMRLVNNPKKHNGDQHRKSQKLQAQQHNYNALPNVCTRQYQTVSILQLSPWTAHWSTLWWGSSLPDGVWKLYRLVFGSISVPCSNATNIGSFIGLSTKSISRIVGVTCNPQYASGMERPHQLPNFPWASDGIKIITLSPKWWSTPLDFVWYGFFWRTWAFLICSAADLHTINRL